MVERIRVSVVYADSQQQIVREIEVVAAATVGDAIRRSGILDELPGFVPAGIGIFGRRGQTIAIRLRGCIELALAVEFQGLLQVHR